MSLKPRQYVRHSMRGKVAQCVGPGVRKYQTAVIREPLHLHIQARLPYRIQGWDILRMYTRGTPWTKQRRRSPSGEIWGEFGVHHKNVDVASFRLVREGASRAKQALRQVAHMYTQPCIAELLRARPRCMRLGVTSRAHITFWQSPAIVGAEQAKDATNSWRTPLRDFAAFRLSPLR